MAEGGPGAQLPAAALRLLQEAQQAMARGATAAAIALYQELLSGAPEYADGWYNLGLLQRQAGQYSAALDAYSQALKERISAPEEVHLNRAVIYSDALRDPDAAAGELQAALLLNPHYLPALSNLATLQEDLGQRTAAQATYERLLALKPQDSQVLARYAQLFGAGPAGAALLPRLRNALRAAATPADGASLGFALARLLDAQGDYPAAFAAAAAANAASRASLSPPAHYERAAQEAFTNDIMRVFARRPTIAAPPQRAAPRPIFICGMFRSGSTLTEQLLAGHPQVASGGELELLPRLVRTQLSPFPAAVQSASAERLEELAQLYQRGLTQLAVQRDYVTDKRPDNFLFIGLIKRLFPQARIVHTTRDPLDTCLSIFFQHLDPRLSYALDLNDLGHYLRQYRRLMAHWRALFGADILDFNYDALVRGPRTETSRLLEFLGLDWHDGCLDFAQREGGVRTASVWQVREELYQRASGRARHYAPQLAALAADLTQQP